VIWPSCLFWLLVSLESGNLWNLATSLGWWLTHASWLSGVFASVMLINAPSLERRIELSVTVKSIKSTTQLKTIVSWPQVRNSCGYNDTLRHSCLQCDANYSRGLDVLNAQLSAVFNVRDSTASKQQVYVENISTAWFIKKAHSVLKSRGGRLCGFIVHCTATAVGSLILVQKKKKKKRALAIS